MKTKSMLSALMAAVLLTTTALPAIAAEKDIIAINAAELSINFCEYVRAVVVEMEGEQPLAMDTHYAMSYMKKAKELGLIADIPMNEWSKPISVLDADAILAKVPTEKSVKVKESLEKLMVNQLSIFGRELDVSDTSIFVRNGNVMLPLRKTAEAMGFAVTWEEGTNYIVLDNGMAKTRLEIGLDSYYKASSQAIGMTQAKPMGTSPMLINDVTYVPEALFMLLDTCNKTVSEGRLSFSK